MVEEKDITEQESKTETVWAKVTPSVKKTVEEMAASDDRTPSYVTCRLIEIGLQHLPTVKGRRVLPRTEAQPA
jgi:hypothetical protein